MEGLSCACSNLHHRMRAPTLGALNKHGQWPPAPPLASTTLPISKAHQPAVANDEQPPRRGTASPPGLRSYRP